VYVTFIYAQVQRQKKLGLNYATFWCGVETSCKINIYTIPATDVQHKINLQKIHSRKREGFY
jgi:uncharacterized protein VirK/YbjX